MKKVGAYWYPDSEEKLCKGSDHTRVSDICQFILPEVSPRRICVTAGGAAGVWSEEYRKHFQHVYAFEPNAALIECFKVNVKGDNVTLIEEALWECESKGKLVECQADNMGAWYIKRTSNGDIPLTTIDSLDLAEVDLIQLDVEGAEIEALNGAEKTIRRCKPVIVAEIKDTQSFYGRKPYHVENRIASIGYERRSKFGRDQLWAPVSR